VTDVGTEDRSSIPASLSIIFLVTCQEKLWISLEISEEQVTMVNYAKAVTDYLIPSAQSLKNQQL
jgi:hypothetical protein